MSIGNKVDSNKQNPQQRAHRWECLETDLHQVHKAVSLGGEAEKLPSCMELVQRGEKTRNLDSKAASSMVGHVQRLHV